MKLKRFIGVFSVHFGLSSGAFLGLYGAALAAQDAGAAAPALAALEPLLRFGLLQPLAHWVLEALTIRWWTWPGLAALGVILAANSALATAVLAGLARALHVWRSQS